MRTLTRDCSWCEEGVGPTPSVQSRSKDLWTILDSLCSSNPRNQHKNIHNSLF